MRSNLRSIHDGDNEYPPPDHETKQPVKVEPRVPFCPELLPDKGNPREQLAAWLVTSKNPNFSRATVNRVWALLLAGRSPSLLMIFARPANCTRPWACSPMISVRMGTTCTGSFAPSRPRRFSGSISAVDDSPTEAQEIAWAVFPMTRLRPEQVAGALFQSSSLATLGPQSHWFIRLTTYTGRNDFVRRYGDTGEDEFDAHGGTIPQRLVLMNGDIVRDKIKADFFKTPSQIADIAPDDRKAVETAFLVVLTRRPTPEEESHFVGRLSGTRKDDRKNRVSDLFWALINTTEFSWNH